eukprot:6152251-Prymnesium_polylepis.1
MAARARGVWAGPLRGRLPTVRQVASTPSYVNGAHAPYLIPLTHSAAQRGSAAGRHAAPFCIRL